MWCYCTKSNHHNCDIKTKKIKCPHNVQHCVIGLTNIFQSCWEWPNKAAYDCPDKVGSCYLLKKNTKLPACCCKGSLCNHARVNYTHPPALNYTEGPLLQFPKQLFKKLPDFTTTLPKESRHTHTLTLSAVLITLVLLVAVLTFILYKGRKKIKCSAANSNNNNKIIKASKAGLQPLLQQHGIVDDTLLDQVLDIRDYQNSELSSKCVKKHQIGLGRFGQIWLADLTHGSRFPMKVALKMFSKNSSGVSSWKNEVIIYSILKTRENSNILKYYGADIVWSGLAPEEYMLVLDYHAHGSLYEYLHQYTVSWEQLLRFCRSIASAVLHIHRFSASISIAHCDIKSKNILVKDDFTACLADFGLGISQNNRERRLNTQVGTCSYMAPEILQGSVNLSLKSFLQVDIFSMSLVFWEILNRCDMPEIGPAECYRQPFEEHLTDHLRPNLEAMRLLVSVEKKRPSLRPEWLRIPKVRTLCMTLEECWDDDPDARISADCIISRLEGLS